MVGIPKGLLTGIIISLLLGAMQTEELGSPRSSFGRGSAEYLQGSNVLYSLFVDTPDSVWTEAEKETVLQRLAVAADYIEDSAKDYHAHTELIYDWKENPGLTETAAVDFSVLDYDEYADLLDEQIADWVDGIASPDKLCEEYQAEGSALLVFINCTGHSYAIVFDGTDSPKESAILFTRETPAVYAHEILHLFGAHDLYKDAEYTREVSEYIRKAYPRELMYTVTDGQGNTYNDKIINEISPVTAYHLGWIDYTEEIDIFPQLKRK